MSNRRVVVVQRMVGFPLFEEEFECCEADELYCVRDNIRTKHGGTAQDIVMWKERVEPANILRDMRVPIKEVFTLSDSQLSATPTRVAIYYDFSPPKGLCPILNAR